MYLVQQTMFEYSSQPRILRKLFQHRDTEIQRIKKLTGNYMAIICWKNHSQRKGTNIFNTEKQRYRELKRKKLYGTLYGNYMLKKPRMHESSQNHLCESVISVVFFNANCHECITYFSWIVFNHEFCGSPLKVQYYYCF